MQKSGGSLMAWNVFRFCTALRALGSIMMVLVLGIIVVTYYVVVIANYGPALFHGGIDSFLALVVLFLFHSLLVMLLWSYFATVITDPGGVSPNWRPSVGEESGDAETDPLVRLEQGRAGLGLNQTSMLGDPANHRMRFCRKCNQFKPPRCHHFSVCEWEVYIENGPSLCVVVNCVGAKNYKYFLLFLLYTFLETTLVTISLLWLFIAFFTDYGEITETPGTLVANFIAFVLNLSFALSVMGFLIMHISFVAANTTTIEAYKKKTSPKWWYDLGRRKNFEQVFGTSRKYWFIPTYSEDDLRHMPELQGCVYPTAPELDELQQL